MLQCILRCTLLARITLQYYWNKYPQGAKDHVYPKEIKIEEERKLLKLKQHCYRQNIRIIGTI